MSRIKNGWKRNWPVFIKSLISIRWTGWRPQLRLIEKYEPIVKWTLRILALLSIISSIFIFPSPFEALGFAIVVFLIQQFFEKSVFVYTTMYVQPMPEFQVEKKEWTAMGYAFPDPPAPDRLNLMGPAFASAGYAAKVFDLFRSWNYDAAEDRDGNIHLSLIVEGNGNYTIYISPNTTRPTAESFFQHGDALKAGPKHGREHQKLVVMVTFCKLFPFAPGSLAHRFIDEQRRNPDRPFWLQAFSYADGKVEMLYDIKPLLMWKITIKERVSLTRQDPEFTFLRHGNKPLKF